MRISLSIILLISSIGATLPLQDKVWRPAPRKPEATRVLLVTGGHEHDVDFYSLFDDPGLRTIVDPHPAAFSGDIRRKHDVLVLYDMIRTLDETRRSNLRAFAESGKGIVVLHHAICANVDWPWWYEELLGGRYLFEPVGGKLSSYEHDRVQTITTVADHPVTRGIGTFRLIDETYHHLWISPAVKVLLRSDDPTSDGPVAWISPYARSRVVYIQLGHDRQATLNPRYRQLVHQAIAWAAGKSN
jgi:type 1 glutamine amidotransferase